MRFTSPLRLPLQTGGTALTTVLFTFILIPFYWGIWPLLVIFLMGRDASRRRASDIILSGDGIDVRGGPHHGFFCPWRSIKPATSYVKETDETFYKNGDDPTVFIQQLVVGDVELARGGEAEEVASFRAVAELVDEAAGAATPVAAALPSVATCPSCGAPLTPVDTDTTRCPYCASVVAVPTEVREAVRQASQTQREKQLMTADVRRALAGGRTSTVNRLILACGISGHVGAPFALLAGLEHKLPLACVPLAVPVILAAMARAAISKRVAVRALAFGCAAIVSADPSHPALCHRCRGPLPPTDGALAVCAYCGATNVIGIDLGSATWARDDFGEVDDVIARHRTRLLKSRAVAIAGIVVGAVGILLSR